MNPVGCKREPTKELFYVAMQCKYLSSTPDYVYPLTLKPSVHSQYGNVP